MPSSTKKVIDVLTDLTMLPASLATTVDLNANNLFQNHILTAHGTEMLQHAMPVLLPVWAIVDASMGIVKEVDSYVTHLSMTDDHDDLAEEMLPFLGFAIKAAINASLFYQGIHALSHACTAVLNPAIFMTFTAKYGMEFIDAMTELSNMSINASPEKLLAARLEVANKGFYFAGFLAITLGGPAVGLVILASNAFFTLTMKACFARKVDKNTEHYSNRSVSRSVSTQEALSANPSAPRFC